MTLTEEAKNMLRVLKRSPKDAEGWAKVSPVVWPLLDYAPRELMEREGDAESGGRARFTTKGHTLLEWVL